jgi:dienelactone hydrolase
VRVQYQDTPLPGYLFRPRSVGRRPTLIVNNGSDGPMTSLWPGVAAGALSRGYNVLLFDGPGQQSMLFEQGVPFRHDWEQVVTPILDFLLARSDVDPARIVLYGISQAGYWVPRALAFEHRVGAAVVDPGVFDAFEPWRKALPAELLKLLETGDAAAFDRMMDEGMRHAPPAERQNWEWRAKPYGKKSAYEVFVEARKYNLTGLTDRITTPMLVTDPDGEQFWPGQSRRLYDALPGPKTIQRFSAEEGADRHCEPMARSLLDQRMFDWLDEQLG